jgi:hypothetical protein
MRGEPFRDGTAQTRGASDDESCGAGKIERSAVHVDADIRWI